VRALGDRVKLGGAKPRAPPPRVRSLKSESEEAAFVGNWLAERAKGGVAPHEFGMFVRSPAQLYRASAAVNAAGLSFKILDEHVETVSGQVSISTMHLARPGVSGRGRYGLRR
jgi:hypothetical protein